MSGRQLPGPTTLVDMYNFTVSDNMYTGQRKDEAGRNGFSGECNYCRKPMDPPCVTCWRPSKTMAFTVLSAGLMAATIVAIICLHITLLRNENKIVDIHETDNTNRRHQHQKERNRIGTNGTETVASSHESLRHQSQFPANETLYTTREPTTRSRGIMREESASINRVTVTSVGSPNVTSTPSDRDVTTVTLKTRDNSMHHLKRGRSRFPT